MKKYINLLIVTVFLAACTGCSSDYFDENERENQAGEEVTEPDESDLVENYDVNYTVEITYNGTSATTSTLPEGVSISQSGADLTIYSTLKQVEYVLSGTTTTGSLKVYSDYKFKLTLDGVSITSSQGPAINIQSGKAVYVVLATDSSNSLTDSSSYPSSSEDMKGCFFSEGQLIFSGSGALTVTGNYKHAICSDDYIIVREDCSITIPHALSDGFHTNDYFIMTSGMLDITAVGEGIECEYGNISIDQGTVTIRTTGEKGHGLKAEGNISIHGGTFALNTTGYSSRCIKSRQDVTISDGKFKLNTTGRGSSEGIESKNILTINGGEFEVITYDDALNASRSIVINGGHIYCYSSNNDGIDSNGTLTVTGGVVISSGTTSPEDGFDCDNNTFTITGGILIGTGGSTSTPTSSVCTQPTVIYGGSGSAGSLIQLRSSDGEDILTYTIPRAYSQMTLLVSTPAMKTGSSYTLYSGGKVEGGTDFYGYNTAGSYSGGSELYTFTLSSMVTTVGNYSGGMGGGGGGNRPGWK